MIFHARLENWIRWACSGRPPRAGLDGVSIKGSTGVVCDRLGRAPELGDVYSGHSPCLPLNVLDAEKVELAWRQLFWRQRDLLRWYHIRKAAPQIICRKMKMPYEKDAFVWALKSAEKLLEKKLEVF